MTTSDSTSSGAGASPPPQPAQSSHRTLVLCFDGSSNMYDADNTNVVKFFSLLKKDDQNTQMCYYQPGIGTFINPGVVSPLFTWGAKMLDLAVAWYLDAHVMGGYTFLMENWRLGDNVCIFGFSRGAYTARALAGLLYKIGLLPRSNVEQIPFAYKLYTRTDKEGVALAAGFKTTFCRKVDVKFMGVWDTVSSVGFIMGRTLPFTNSNSSIETFRHALSLDEHRSKFRPNYFHRPAPSEDGAKNDPEHGSPIIQPGQDSSSATHSTPKMRVSKGKNSPLRNFFNRKSLQALTEEVIGVLSGVEEQDIDEDKKPATDVLEVFFAGCHSVITDVGGGSVSDVTPHMLGSISLRWMVRQVMISQCGIQFDDAALKRLSIPTTTSFTPFTLATPQTGAAEQSLDTQDAVADIHDSLSLKGWNWEAPLWWILEVIPSTFRWQDSKGVWKKNFTIHLGRGRDIVEEKPQFHATVKQRMKLGKYKPKAKWVAGSEVYVQ